MTLMQASLLMSLSLLRETLFSLGQPNVVDLTKKTLVSPKYIIVLHKKIMCNAVVLHASVTKKKKRKTGHGVPPYGSWGPGSGGSGGWDLLICTSVVA